MKPDDKSTVEKPGHPVRLRALGHASIKATHHKTLELTADQQLSGSGTCIIGVAAEASMDALLGLRGPVRLTLSCGGLADSVRARMNPLFIASDPLIVRIHPAPQHRSLCIGADKSAADLDRDLIAALQSPGAELDISITPEPDGRPVPGVLFVVATPIGDRRDLSPRADATLRSVDLIVAEDTRTARTLLGGVRAEMLSLHDHNERGRVPEVIDRLGQGDRVALISEAGMPLVSDPGFHLVRAAADADCLVVPVPGPDAVTTALSVAGLPTDAFQFIGFLPRKAGERRRRLAELRDCPQSTVFFEAPHRILDSLDAAAAELGDRAITACRNLTKPGEEILRGTAASVADRLRARDAVRGEFTVVIAPGEPEAPTGLSDELAAVARSLVEAGVPTKTIGTALAKGTGASKRDMFNLVLTLKDGSAKDD